MATMFRTISIVVGILTVIPSVLFADTTDFSLPPGCELSADLFFTDTERVAQSKNHPELSARITVGPTNRLSGEGWLVNGMYADVLTTKTDKHSSVEFVSRASLVSRVRRMNCKALGELTWAELWVTPEERELYSQLDRVSSTDLSVTLSYPAALSADEARRKRHTK